MAVHFVGLLLSSIRVRFQWLETVPWAFARVCQPHVAAAILEQWGASPPEQHHRVTVRVVREFERQIRDVAAGLPACPALVAEERTFRQAPLSEAAIEGFHAEVAKAARRANSAQLPHIFGQLRLQANLERARRWSERPGGESIVCHEWSRYKRVVKIGDNQSRHGARLPMKALLSEELVSDVLVRSGQ